MQTPAFAHQSGCHRWHSCPSDHGTYTCGDTGHCSQCPDNDYCKGGIPLSITSTYTSNPTSTTSPAVQSSPKTNLVPTQTGTCDDSLWSHVYHPQRLKVLDQCKTVSGVIKGIKKEKDGDYHIQLKLDQQFSNLVNSANVKSQHGYLVLEPVCQNNVEQQDAKSACFGFVGKVQVPRIGSHVIVTGSYVLDLQHDSWAEIHPVTSIVKIS